MAMLLRILLVTLALSLSAGAVGTVASAAPCEAGELGCF